MSIESSEPRSGETSSALWMVYAPTVAVLGVAGALLVLLTAGVRELAAWAAGSAVLGGLVVGAGVSARKFALKALQSALAKIGGPAFRRRVVLVAVAGMLGLALFVGLREADVTAAILAGVLLALALGSAALQVAWFRRHVRRWRELNKHVLAE